MQDTWKRGVAQEMPFFSELPDKNRQTNKQEVWFWFLGLLGDACKLCVSLINSTVVVDD